MLWSNPDLSSPCHATSPREQVLLVNWVVWRRSCLLVNASLDEVGCQFSAFQNDSIMQQTPALGVNTILACPIPEEKLQQTLVSCLHKHACCYHESSLLFMHSQIYQGATWHAAYASNTIEIILSMALTDWIILRRPTFLNLQMELSEVCQREFAKRRPHYHIFLHLKYNGH